LQRRAGRESGGRWGHCKCAKGVKKVCSAQEVKKVCSKSVRSTLKCAQRA
jgi:hypothetical protein